MKRDIKLPTELNLDVIAMRLRQPIVVVLGHHSTMDVD
jgi:hypothetical protein